jgi:hypothetical protein
MLCNPDSALPAALEAGTKLCEKCDLHPVAQPRDRICPSCHAEALARHDARAKAQVQRARRARAEAAAR